MFTHNCEEQSTNNHWIQLKGEFMEQLFTYNTLSTFKNLLNEYKLKYISVS